MIVSSTLKLSIVSGGFDPLHEGHIYNILSANAISGYQGVIVILNSDEWLQRKKGKYFQNLHTRSVVVGGIKGVIWVLVCNDDDGTVCNGLRKVRLMYPSHNLTFCKGGDRVVDTVPEVLVCNELNIDVLYGVGGEKCNSSSDLLAGWVNNSAL